MAKQPVLTKEELILGNNYVIDKVMAYVNENELQPLVLIAGDSDEMRVLPCGPCPDEVVWDLLRRLVHDHDAEGR